MRIPDTTAPPALKSCPEDITCTAALGAHPDGAAALGENATGLAFDHKIARQSAAGDRPADAGTAGDVSRDVQDVMVAPLAAGVVARRS
jgi:hypothetical protein